MHQAYSCEEENLNIAMAMNRASELWAIRVTVAKVAPESSTRKQSFGTFKPTNDTKVVQIDPDDAGKTIWISYGMSNEQELMFIDFLLWN
jgi:hypothetical protein